MKEEEFDKDVKQAIIAEQRREQKEFLHSLETDLSQKSSKRFDWRIAASVAVIIGLACSFFLFNQSPSSDALYAEYFSPYSNVVEPIVRDQISLSKKAEAFAQYEKGEYLKAINSFDALRAQDSLDVITRDFYKANAFLQLDEFDQATKLLQKVVDQNKEWKDESQWYLALISLKLNNVDACISYLKELQKNSLVFKDQVNALLDEID